MDKKVEIATIGGDYVADDARSTYTDSPPPAYQKPELPLVKVAKIAATTILALVVIFCAFTLLHTYIKESAKCTELEAKLAAAYPLPQASQVIQFAESTSRRPRKKKTTTTAAPVTSTTAAPSPNDGAKRLSFPIHINMDEITGKMMEKNQRARLNCMIEKKRSEEIIPRAPKTLLTPFGNLTTDPKFTHITGETMTLTCRSGNERQSPSPQAIDEDDEPMGPMMERPGVPPGPVIISIPLRNPAHQRQHQFLRTLELQPPQPQSTIFIQPLQLRSQPQPPVDNAPSPLPFGPMQLLQHLLMLRQMRMKQQEREEKEREQDLPPRMPPRMPQPIVELSSAESNQPEVTPLRYGPMQLLQHLLLLKQLRLRQLEREEKESSEQQQAMPPHPVPPMPQPHRGMLPLPLPQQPVPQFIQEQENRMLPPQQQPQILQQAQPMQVPIHRVPIHTVPLAQLQVQVIRHQEPDSQQQPEPEHNSGDVESQPSNEMIHEQPHTAHITERGPLPEGRAIHIPLPIPRDIQPQNEEQNMPHQEQNPQPNSQQEQDGPMEGQPSEHMMPHVIPPQEMPLMGRAMPLFMPSHSVQPRSSTNQRMKRDVGRSEFGTCSCMCK